MGIIMNTEFHYKNKKNEDISLTLDNDRITKIKNYYNGMKDMFNDNDINNHMVKDISIHTNLTDKIKRGSIEKEQFQELTNSIRESIWHDKTESKSKRTTRTKRTKRKNTTSGGKKKKKKKKNSGGKKKKKKKKKS